MAPPALTALLRDGYAGDDVRHIEDLLGKAGTLTFARLPSGLYPASSLESGDRSSGYQYVWTRDNVHIGWAHFVSGDVRAATDVAAALLAFYWKYRRRFEAIVAGDADAEDVGNRPHVRFDGSSLTEVSSERWPHAQNDALGYVLWYCATLLGRAALRSPRHQDWDMLVLLVRYFEAIRYWEDADSGHWEEARKISASSIGVVVAGLDAWIGVLRAGNAPTPDSVQRSKHIDLAADLAQRGRRALARILPSECTQGPPSLHRAADSALLFLLHPLRVLSEDVEAQILRNCEGLLRGEHGFRRYLGDSYWAPDYDVKLGPEDRTRDFSNDLETRDVLLPRIGLEAQWCIFDTAVSAYFGSRYQRDRDARDLARQTAYLNRGLLQVTTGDARTPAWRCPELYYLRDGVYAANPHVPLQWAQANLLVALQAMRQSLSGSDGRGV